MAQALLPLNVTFHMDANASKKPAGASTEVHDGPRNVNVEGFISRPVVEGTRTLPECRMVFVNSRPCKLPCCTRAIKEWYKRKNSVKPRFFMINIKLSTHAYDINVSPSKETIRLYDEASLLSLLKIALDEQVVWPETHAPSVPSQLASIPVEEGPESEPISDGANRPFPSLPDNAGAQEILQQNSEGMGLKGGTGNQLQAHSRRTDASARTRVHGSENAPRALNRKRKRPRNMSINATVDTTQTGGSPSTSLKSGGKTPVRRGANPSKKLKGTSYLTQLPLPNQGQTGASMAITQHTDVITIDSEESEDDTDSNDGVGEEEHPPPSHSSVIRPSNAISADSYALHLRSHISSVFLNRFHLYEREWCIWCATKLQDGTVQRSCRQCKTATQTPHPQPAITKVKTTDLDAMSYTLSKGQIDQMRIVWRDFKRGMVGVLVEQEDEEGTPSHEIPLFVLFIKLQPLELTQAEEVVIEQHIDALRENGFAIEWNDAAPKGSRCSLLSRPKYSKVVLDQDNLKAILFMLTEPIQSTPVLAIASKIWRIFAVRGIRRDPGSLPTAWYSETTALRLGRLREFKSWREGDGVVGVDNEAPPPTNWISYVQSQKSEIEGTQDSRSGRSADSAAV